MPSHAGYEPIAGSEEEAVGRPSLDSQDGMGPTTTTTTTKRRVPGVDLKGIDTAFKRWTDAVAQKVKINRRKRLEVQPEKREIAFSVFQQTYGKLPPPPQRTLDHQPPITHEEFELIVQSIRAAIFEGIHPKMISKGSSGSYYARVRDSNGQIKTVGVFKPKDEEVPYSMRNPKFQKWVHRTFFWWIGFGRSCLIPNLSYISEAGASLLDTRLNLNIVPHTELASFASPAFFYDWIDRNAAKKGKALPEKIGSLQLFAHGFTDASDFLRKHPWPGRSITDTWNEDDHREGRNSKRCFNACGILCGKAGGDFDDYEDDDIHYEQNGHAQDAPMRAPSASGGSFAWTPALQQSFREELEKLIILDYLMRNTDRGLDNFMIKYCEGSHEKQVVDKAPTTRLPMMSEVKSSNMPTQPASHMSASGSDPSGSSQYRRPHVHIAAIDNSLSFPHQHPKGWRSYTYGWLFLPVSLIGRPFSENTRNHFLPLLSSPEWWAETIFQLRKLFSLDPDFNERMFDRQMAVLKGQGWNIVQSLKREEEGPLELTRRIKVLVWDEEVEVVSEPATDTDDGIPIPNPSRLRPNPISQTPQAIRKVMSPTLFQFPRRQRSRSISDFPPPRPRAPVPFSRAIGTTQVGGASGVSVLAQLERLDKVSGGKDDAVVAEESAVVFSPTETSPRNSRNDVSGIRSGPSRVSPVPEHDEIETMTPPPPPPPPIPRVASDPVVLDDELDGEDDGINPIMFSSVTSLGDHAPIPPSMTRSATAAQTRPSLGHGRWPSYTAGGSGGGGGGRGQRLSLDTATASDVVSGKTRTVIRERLQTVDSKAFFQNW
ncbi:phosphatidylinositol 3- and 4-kinase [Ceratobasidium sp. AG-Ba]|nr:phosphatidylinositol 3- and 4-kinase [Ceratobasidium sp. AG-Ba]